MTVEQALQLLMEVGFTIEPRPPAWYIAPTRATDGGGTPPDGSLVQGELLTESGLIMLAENLFKIYNHFLKTDSPPSPEGCIP